MTQPPVTPRRSLRRAVPRYRPLLAGLALTTLALTGCSDVDPAASSSSVPSQASAPAGTTVSASGETASAVAVTEQSYANAWGPQAGSTIPQLAASDHTGQPQTLASLSGDKGLLLVFSRSADW